MTLQSKICVFGGNGFVGSAILRGLVAKGLKPISFSRTGLVPKHFEKERWSGDCTWKPADALKPETYKDDILGSDAIIISIGSPPLPTFSKSEYDNQVRANGTTCATVIETANEAGVKQVVLVNAAMPSWIPKGYREGKEIARQAAEKFALEKAEHGATILYPSGIYGTRYTSGGTPIPLTPFLLPASAALGGLNKLGFRSALESLSPSLFKNALEPPVSVDKVAAAAILGATDPSFRGKLYNFTVGEMHELN